MEKIQPKKAFPKFFGRETALIVFLKDFGAICNNFQHFWRKIRPVLSIFNIFAKKN